MAFVTRERWTNRRWSTKAIDRIDFVPTALLDCWGVPIRKRWIDGDRGTGQSLGHGRRFDLSPHAALYWETVPVDRPDLLPKQLGDVPHLVEGGCLKERIVLHRQPVRVRWRVAMDFPIGVTLHYQPALTPEEIAEGCHRPESVVGSYAVFDGGGAKIGHVLRPFAVDDAGEFTWLVLDRDTAAGVFTIRGDAAWFARAKYPVIIDPTFGYTSIGASNINFGLNYIRANGPYSPASSGDATEVSLYGNTGSSLVTQGIYGESGGNPSALLRDTGGSTMPSSVGWKTQILDSSLPISSGTTYFIGHGHGFATANGCKYDTDASYFRRSEAWAYVAGNLPATYPSITFFGGANYRVSHYITYVEAVGGNPWYAYAQQ